MAGMGVFFSWMLIVPLGVRFLMPGGKPMRWAFIAAMVIACHLFLERRTDRTTME
jgi:hypothetical protein